MKPARRLPRTPLLRFAAEFFHADVRVEDDVRALVDKTIERFGRLDVAVNNAATEGQVGPLQDQTAATYAETFDTNVLGVLLSMKHEARVMQGQGSGSIVNISSTYGHKGAPGAAVYVASKHAVEGMTKSVALELADSGIRVNAVAPGPTDTGMLTRFTATPENKAALVADVPMRRLGLSEELAESIVFIAGTAWRLRVAWGAYPARQPHHHRTRVCEGPSLVASDPAIPRLSTPVSVDAAPSSIHRGRALRVHRSSSASSRRWKPVGVAAVPSPWDRAVLVRECARRTARVEERETHRLTGACSTPRVPKKSFRPVA